MKVTLTCRGIRIAVLVSLLGALFPRAVPAQYGGQQTQPPPQQQQQPGKPALQGQQPQQSESPKVDPEEEKAYQDFYNLDVAQPDKIIQSGEQFVAKHPQSKYDEAVYSRLTQAYFTKQDMDKMYAAGDKALALNPDDVSILVLIGWVIPHKYDPNDPESDRRLTKSEGYEKHALQLLASMPKPANVSDEQFAKSKAQASSQAHAGLGLVYYWRQQLSESASELQQAVKDSPTPDPTDLYVMGMDYEKLKRYPDAADAFQKCAAIPNGLQSRCKQGADEAKKQTGSQPAQPKP
jgi:tetratricopeptide (TPR) repeat protein